MSEIIADNMQLGSPVNTYVPGDDKQLVDLDEYFVETEQGQVDAVVQGSESLALGKFCRKNAIKIGLKNARDMDPFPSERNAVIGAEGFFSTLYEGFKKVIENIIKWIRMACNWVAETIKGIFGFKKSARIEKAINDSFENLREEFRTVLKGLGFPSDQYNLETFIGQFPNATDRVGQLMLMKSKFDTDEGAMKGLGDALPILQQVVGKLTEASNKVTKQADFCSKTIREEYNKTRARQHLSEDVNGNDSPECNRVMKACLEVLATLRPEEVLTECSKLINVLYKTEFTNEALTEGIGKLRTELDSMVKAQAVNLTQMPISTVMTNIQHLNAAYVGLSANSMDMSRINLKALGNIVDKDDAAKVEMMSKYYNHRGVLEAYQTMAVGVRNFTNFCQLVSRQMLVVERQVVHVVGWYHRAHMWYYHGLLDDFEKLRAINQAARAAGAHPQADAAGNPTYEMDFIPEADSKTFMEKFGGTAQEVIEKDIGGLRTRYNNFVKQSGWGKGV
ncbi:hypothetical protein D3C81_424710 [compost metagenome]